MISSLEKIVEEYKAKENFSALEKIHYLELELEELRNQTEKNPFHAGRKKDTVLKEHIQKCLKDGMKAKDIIGSEYVNKDGATKKVAQASFYRIKKEINKEQSARS